MGLDYHVNEITATAIGSESKGIVNRMQKPGKFEYTWYNVMEENWIQLEVDASVSIDISIYCYC